MYVLSASILNADAFERALAILAKPDSFYAPANRRLWEAMISLREDGQPIDSGTISSWLRSRERLVEIGGIAYLAKLLDAVPSVENVESYARTVKNLATQRSIVATCQEFAATGYGDVGDVRTWANEVAERLDEIARTEESRRTTATIAETIRDIFEPLARGEAPAGKRIATGLPSLDERLSMHVGDLVFVAGRPGMGKSAVAGGFAIGATKETWHDEACAALIFSAEMRREQLVQRYVSSEARFPFQRLQRADIPNDAWPRLTVAARELSRLGIWLDDKGAPSVAHVRATLRKVRREIARNVRREDGKPTEVRLVVVDYLQIMSTPKHKNRRRDEELSDITGALKAIAQDEQVCIVCLSQLNRKVEERPNKRPILSDLRESGSIEQDADAIVFVYRDEYYNKDSAARGRAELLIEKQRNGPSGVRAIVGFDGAYTLFRELTAEEQRQLEHEQAEERGERPSPPRRNKRWGAARVYQPPGDD